MVGLAGWVAGWLAGWLAGQLDCGKGISALPLPISPAWLLDEGFSFLVQPLELLHTRPIAAEEFIHRGLLAAGDHPRQTQGRLCEVADQLLIEIECELLRLASLVLPLSLDLKE